MQKTLGSVAILGTALMYGSYGVFANLIGQDFDLFFQTYARSIIAWVIVVCIVVFLREWKRIRSGYDLSILFLITFLGVFTQAVYYAYAELGVGLASVLYFSAMLLAQFVIGFVLFKEKLTLIKSAAFFLAVGGVVVLFANDIHAFSLFPAFVALLAGVAIGAQASATKLISNFYSGWQISVFSWLGVILVCLPISLLLGETQAVPALTLPWIYLLIFSIVGLAVFPLLIYGYRRIDMSVGGLIGLLEVPAAVLFGALVFSEHITNTIIIGSTIIMLAAMLPHIAELYQKRATKVV